VADKSEQTRAAYDAAGSESKGGLIKSMRRSSVADAIMGSSQSRADHGDRQEDANVRLRPSMDV